MKLLFDQNVSYRIISKLSNHFPNSEQVKRLNLYNQNDIVIWNFSKENNYTIVTFDADFVDIANINNHPPKIIWLRTGNLTTDSIAEILIANKEIIIEFIAEQQTAVLEITKKL